MTPSRRGTDVEHHRPGPAGSCDHCGGDDHPQRGAGRGNATHRLPDGTDLCGWHYGIHKGYITPTGERGETA